MPLRYFKGDHFSVTKLTAAINDLELVPGRIAELGLFEEEGVPTTTIQVEREGDMLNLVKATDRGSPGQVATADKRILIPLNTVHLPERATIMADEVQGVRQFGTESELDTVENVVNKRLRRMKLNLDATHEWQRIGAIRGKVLDADPNKLLLDVYQAFNVRQTSIKFELSNAGTKVRAKCMSVLTSIEDALGGVKSTGVRAFCGNDFWNEWIEHPGVKETYLNSEQAASLRGDPRESFQFGGIVWERYSGKVGSMHYVPVGEAFAFPEGVSELFVTRFAPANYIETVNTIGLPYYAKTRNIDFDKGVELEAQSNPIHLCTRPKAVIKLEK